MTIVNSTAADGFIQRLPNEIRFYLVHGLDEGLTHERVRAIVRSRIGDDSDPMSLVRLEGDAVARDPGALAVHGLTTEFLRDKPKFVEIANELRDFVQGADLIIHNAPFDIGFLDVEFGLLGLPAFSSHCGEVIDTLVRAKAMFPGKRNSLDALCDRFGISNAHRTLHGALLDSELLAEVYLAMTRGQESLVIDMLGETSRGGDEGAPRVALNSLELPVIVASEEEIAARLKGFTPPALRWPQGVFRKYVDRVTSASVGATT